MANCTSGKAEPQAEENRPGARRAPYPLRVHIGALVHEVARHRRNLFDKMLKPAGVTRSQRWVLIHLSQMRGEGISQKDLADRMNIGQPALGEKIALLLENGHITRRPDTRDKRQRLIFMTERGYDVLEESRAISQRTNKDVLSSLCDADVAIAERVLSTMLQNIERLEAELDGG